MSDVSHRANVCPCAPASWLAASAAPAGKRGMRPVPDGNGSSANRLGASGTTTAATHAEQQSEHDQRSPAESADRRDVGRRRDSGDEQRDDERDDRHPNRVHPQRADRRDGVGGVERRRAPRRRDDHTTDDRRAERDEDSRAFFHLEKKVVCETSGYIIRSPPLMSSDVPVM